MAEILGEIDEVLEAKGVVFDEDNNIDFQGSTIEYEEIAQTIGDVFSITYTKKQGRNRSSDFWSDNELNS